MRLSATRAAPSDRRRQARSGLRRLCERKDLRGLLGAQIAGVGGGTSDRGGGTSAIGGAATRCDRYSPENFRTRKTGRKSLQVARSGRTASTARNGAIELHLRPRKSFSYLHFAVRPARPRQRNRRL